MINQLGAGLWGFMSGMGMFYDEPEPGGIRLDFKFEDIDDFYKAAEEFDKDNGQFHQNEEIRLSERRSFSGLSIQDIHKYKYGYQPGISKLEEVKEDLLIDGASCFKHKWDDVDGEEMSMDRFYDEIPFLQKRIRKHGFLGGKFIKVYVSINELAMVSYESMLNRTYTAVSIIDYLESLGYRTEVYATSFSINKGSYKNDWASEVYSEVLIKKSDEALNLSLLLTMLSPWSYRYWHFLMFSGHFKTSSGMGSTRSEGKSSQIGELYLQSGECLTKEASKKFINEIKEMYDQTMEEEIYD